MFIMGCFAFVSSTFMVINMSIFAGQVAYKTRLDYFKKCLQKDAAFYDANPPVSMASRISKECAAIERGIGDKVGSITYSMSSFVLGFVFAFYWGWLYACILLAVFPFAAASGAWMGAMFESGMVEQMKAYAQSAGYAEQAL